MRLTRLAAVGLAIGVIAGFAIALLRPRPHVPSVEGPAGSAEQPGPSADAQLWEQFRKADRASIVELRSSRRMIG
jgi:hypothetical protein